MAIMPMCSECSSPVFVHEAPPLIDLYTPSPKETLRWLLFSPVPTQMTLESLGSIVMQPME